MSGTAPTVPARLCFGDYTLELQPARLSLRNAPVTLQSQPLRLLTLLASRAGEVVPHKDIRQHVWGALQVDFASGMHVCIAQIRKALDDHGEPPQYIETVPRRGYRFVAPVHAAPGPAATPPPSAAATPLVAPGPARGSPPAWAWSWLTLCFTGCMAVAYLGGGRPPAQVEPSASTAADPTQAYPEAVRLLATGDLADALRGRALLQRAIMADPDFAPAHAALARSYERTRDYAEAQRAAELAHAVDPTYAQAHVRLAAARIGTAWDWHAAEAELQKALDLAPQDTEARLARAALQLVKGRREALRADLAEAIAQYPDAAAIEARVGLLHYYAWDFAPARAHCEAALRLDPALRVARECLYRLARIARDDAHARTQALELLRLEGADSGTLAAVAAGSAAVAVQDFESRRLAQLARSAQPDPLLQAYSLATLRRYDEAFFQLRRAHEQRYAETPLASFDPVFIPIRHQSKYLEMLDGMGVVYAGL